jgi:hypothetical protein
MTPEGFCHHCRADVPAASGQPRPTCSRCGWYPLIPPSFGRRTQQWVDGAWVPFIPKPEGYVWKDPQVRAREIQTADANETRACEQCGKAFEVGPRSVRRYCTSLCKNRAQHARVMARKGAAA